MENYTFHGRMKEDLTLNEIKLRVQLFVEGRIVFPWISKQNCFEIIEKRFVQQEHV